MTTAPASGDGRPGGRRLRRRSKTSLFASGEPALWLLGGALAICTAMVVGLLALVLWKGLETFWPRELLRVETVDGRVYMGEVTRTDTYRPDPTLFEALEGDIATRAVVELEENEGFARRRLFRTGNYRLTQTHFHWVDAYEIAEESRPEWAMVVERQEWGRFYGEPVAFAKIDRIEAESVEAQRARIREVLDADDGPDVRLVVERTGRFTLVPVEELDTLSGLVGIARLTMGPEAALEAFRTHHGPVRERWERRRELEKHDTGELNHRQEEARLRVRESELALEEAETGGASADQIEKLRAALEEERGRFEEVRVWAGREFDRIRDEIDAINRDNAAYQLWMRTSGEGEKPPRDELLRLDDIVRAYPANHLDLGTSLGIYVSRWREFLVDEPREANAEGGVYPAIFGTVAMTLIMSFAVVPFGVLAALYLREYAKAGTLVSIVRIAVNNLAGVPSIVFGVFGLGFFCYVVGASIDELLFAASLPNPTYGKGGLLWASLTLALLTLPVVIVATEEAIAAVPNSMREGSYACGASKWQTIRRIVLPRALPGIITGAILAIARGAGEVAPLMLVGAVKLAPELPVDSVAPYLHPERSFMHLGFHIYDVGFQSQNSEASKPMVFTTTLLLIALVAVLNLAAIWLRGRLRRKFAGSQF